MDMSTLHRAFVQVGATRDGLDPYLDAARERSLSAVLVETPAYLRWRRQLGRRPFDAELAVEHPADPEEVRCALGSSGRDTALVLPGFERYAASAYAVAARLGVPPQSTAAERFIPPDKTAQRALLARRAPSVLQPRHVVVPLHAAAGRAPRADLRFPAVVKPADAGGGLGVFLVRGEAQLDRAIEEIRNLTNYDGAGFDQILIEDYIEGIEHSIQALARRGRARLLTACEKIITLDRAGGEGDLVGFREAAHVAAPRCRALPGLEELAQTCIDAMGYRDGPFHVDLIRDARGLHFIEMGFRLSGGGLVELVRKATGRRWADLSLAAHLDRLGERGAGPAAAEAPRSCVGQATLRSEGEVEAAERLRERGLHVEIERSPGAGGDPETADEDEGKSLASDRLRHGGLAGRVTLYGDDRDEIRRHLRGCLAPRPEP
jgi:ATP-grasp domain